MCEQIQTCENCRFKQEKIYPSNFENKPDDPDMWCIKKDAPCLIAESCDEWELNE